MFMIRGMQKINGLNMSTDTIPHGMLKRANQQRSKQNCILPLVRTHLPRYKNSGMQVEVRDEGGGNSRVILRLERNHT